MSLNSKVAKRKRKKRFKKQHPLKTLCKVPLFGHLHSSLAVHLPRWLPGDVVCNNLIELLECLGLQDQGQHLAWCRHHNLGRNYYLKKRGLSNWSQIFRRNKSLRSKKMSNPLTLSQPLLFLRQQTLGQRIYNLLFKDFQSQRNKQNRMLQSFKKKPNRLLRRRISTLKPWPLQAKQQLNKTTMAARTCLTTDSSVSSITSSGCWLGERRPTREEQPLPCTTTRKRNGIW